MIFNVWICDLMNSFINSRRVLFCFSFFVLFCFSRSLGIFPFRQPCHLYLKAVLFLVSWYICLFPFLDLLYWIGHPKLCWTGMVRVNNACLFPSLSGESSQPFTITLMLAVGFLLMLFIKLNKFCSISILLRLFIMGGCWILLNVSSLSVDIIMWLSFFSLWLWWITLIF